MTHGRIAEVLRLAADNHGLIRVDHVTSLGIHRNLIGRMTAAGILEPAGGPGIRRLAAGEPSAHQLLLGAVWASGPSSAASHLGAGWLWQLDPIESPHLDVAVPHSCGRRPAGVRLHYSAAWTPGLITHVDGIPVTEPTLTLLDLASVLTPGELERAFDSALRQGLTTPRRAEAILRRLGRRGRNGTAALRALLESRALVDGISDTDFEVRLIQVLRRGGLPDPVRQVPLYDVDGFIGRFDCAYPEALIAIEADSVRHHHDRERFEKDRERRARAEAIGWRVPSFTFRQVTRNPQWVARSVAGMLDTSGWRWRKAG